MASTITTQTLLNAMNLDLDQGANTSIYQLDTGDGTPGTGGNTLTAEQGAVIYLNREMRWLCRNVFMLESNFTVTFSSAQWNRRYDAFAVATDGTPGDTTTTGAKLWWPRTGTMTSATGGTKALEYAGSEYLYAIDRNYQAVWDATIHTGKYVGGVTAALPPRFFYRVGERAFGLYPVPVATVTVVTGGIYIPADMQPPSAVPAGTLDWCEPALAELLPLGAELRAINKARQNATLTARENDIVARRNVMLMDVWSNLPWNLRDPRSVDAPYKMPPVAGAIK